MNTKERIENIVESLEKTGSDFYTDSQYSNYNERNHIILTVEELLKKDISLKEIITKLSNNLVYLSDEFLSSYAFTQKGIYKNISGLSSAIYIENKINYIKLNIIGGNKRRNEDGKIDENTVFDLASITKLFTLLLMFRLEYLGLIDLNTKIKDVNKDIQGLEDFTFNDLLKMYGNPCTNGNINKCNSSEELFYMLYNSSLKDYIIKEENKEITIKGNTRNYNKYTDIGLIIITDTLSKMFNKKYSDILDEYIIKPLDLEHTSYLPKGDNISGNEIYDNSKCFPHDPKAYKILSKTNLQPGHAGLFSNSDDLIKVASSLFKTNLISKQYINRMGAHLNVNGYNHHGNGGLYLKMNDGLKLDEARYVPSESSYGSFGMQGWTGPIIVIDPNNKLSINILVNAIYRDNNNLNITKNDKIIGFKKEILKYEHELYVNAIMMLLANRYFELYKNNEIETIEHILKLY